MKRLYATITKLSYKLDKIKKINKKLKKKLKKKK